MPLIRKGAGGLERGDDAAELRALRRSSMYLAFSQTNRVIVRSHEDRQLIQGICDVCVMTGQALLACIVLEQDDTVLFAGAGPQIMMKDAERNMVQAIRTPGNVAYEAIHSDEPAIVEDLGEYMATTQWMPIGQRMGMQELAAFPIGCGGQACGALIVAATDGDYFDRDMILILTEIAGQTSFALDSLAADRARLAALREARQSNERFMVALDSLPISASITDLADYSLRVVNTAFCERYGLTRDEVLGRSLDSSNVVVSERMREDFYASIRTGGTVRNLPIELRRPDGSYLCLLVSGQPIEFEKRESVLITSIDVTELHERQRRLAGILDATHEVIVTIDRELDLVVFNRAAERVFGYPADQMLGTSVLRLVTPERRNAAAQTLRGVIETGKLPSGADPEARYEYLSALGERIPVHVTVSRSGPDADPLVTLVMHDLREHEAAEREHLARLRAEAASSAKSEFISQMSHELRTPLNAVIGFADLLRQRQSGPLNERQAAHVEAIREAGWHLLMLTEDVLDLSKVEAGKVSLNIVHFDLRSLLDEVIRLVENQAQAAGVSLRADYLLHRPVAVEADRLRLSQALLNVVNNAIKYNRVGGRVTIAIDEGPSMVSVRVVDTGIGMNGDQLTHLFERFNRLGRDRSSIEGTGLGLVLSRQLVQLMGGDIAVDSKSGHGTQVSVTVPRGDLDRMPSSGDTDAASVAADGDDDLTGVVLYVDDNDLNAYVMLTLLERWPGLRVIHARDSASGMRGARDHRPDLLILDMDLSDVDSLSLLARLRGDPVTRGVPVFALLGDGGPVTEESFGPFDDVECLTKPIAPARFAERLRARLGQRVPR
ncbi:MAG: PAS domain S-box protein [Burkholderiaceae bacterium]